MTGEKLPKSRNFPGQGLPWWLSGKESAWSRKIPHASEQQSPCTTIETVL